MAVEVFTAPLWRGGAPLPATPFSVDDHGATPPGTSLSASASSWGTARSAICPGGLLFDASGVEAWVWLGLTTAEAGGPLADFRIRDVTNGVTLGTFTAYRGSLMRTYRADLSNVAASTARILLQYQTDSDDFIFYAWLGCQKVERR